MLRSTQRLAVVGLGAYEISGNRYPYAMLTTGEGEPMRFSVGQDVDPNLPVLQWVKATVEFRQDGNKVKSRLTAWEAEGK
jgi:hypothetical protein